MQFVPPVPRTGAGQNKVHFLCTAAAGSDALLIPFAD
jgi:hypothetical protein